MQGTEKQVKWATDIKAEIMGHIDLMAAAIKRQHAGKPTEAKVGEMIAQVMAVIDSRDAAYWIDNRMFNGSGKVDQDAPKRIWQEAVKAAAAK